MDKCKNITGVFLFAWYTLHYVISYPMLNHIESLISNTRKNSVKSRSFFKNQMNIISSMTLDDRKDVILFSFHDDSDFLKHFD